MTLNSIHDSTHSSCIINKTFNWDQLYSSQIWSDKNLRKAIIDGPILEKKEIKYCYTCRGKIRNYTVKSPKPTFVPSNHSTPKLSSLLTNEENSKQMAGNILDNSAYRDTLRHLELPGTNIELTRVGPSQCIPTISQQIEANFPKYRSTEYDAQSYRGSQRRLSKSLKGLKCIVNFSLTDSPKKKRTQIQACSISIMIVAIVIISLILVNFTTSNFINLSNVTSTIMVPITQIDYNESSTSTVIYDSNIAIDVNDNVTPKDFITFEQHLLLSSKNHSSVSNVIAKIRKNIKTYPKETTVQQTNKPIDVTARDLYKNFCSCQNNKVCMLDEQSGKAVCKEAIDIQDPTGCGGLCEIEAEACHLINETLGVRVCQRLPSALCTSQDFRCHNGICVPIGARCDGIIQCNDRSDELQCECDYRKNFRCGQAISCFPKIKKCDGVIDCWDGYDEVNCTKECPKEKFTCNDGECIPSAKFCDGFADCGDKTDEPNGCEVCGKHEMRCENHRCIPLSARCDGRDDCEDRSDEMNCS